jgi:hypothetical protein
MRRKVFGVDAFGKSAPFRGGKGQVTSIGLFGSVLGTQADVGGFVDLDASGCAVGFPVPCGIHRLAPDIKRFLKNGLQILPSQASFNQLLINGRCALHGLFEVIGYQGGYHGQNETSCICKSLIIKPTWRNWQTR